MQMLVLFIMAAGIADGKSDPEADEIRDSYHQVVEAVPAVLVRFESKGGITKSYGERSAELLALYEKKFAAMSTADQKKHRVEFEMVKERLKRFSAFATVEESPPSTIEIIKDSGGVEVRDYVSASAQDLRRDSAKQKGVSSFTGGEYAKYVLDRSTPQVTWKSLDPYPFPGDTRPVYAIRKGELDMGEISFLPPLVGGIPIKVDAPDVIGSLMSREKVAPLRFFDLRSEKKVVVVGARFGQSLYLAGFNLKQSRLPVWVAECLYAPPHSSRGETVQGPRPLTKPDVLQIVECVEKMFQTDRYDVPSALVAGPAFATHYFDFREVEGIPTAYPFEGKRREFEGYATEPRLPITLDSKWGSQLRSEGICVVKKIQAPPPVSPSLKMDYPEGSYLIDANLNKSGIVGLEEKVIDQVLPTERLSPPSRISAVWLLIVANVVLLIALIVYLFFRRRRRREVTVTRGV